LDDLGLQRAGAGHRRRAAGLAAPLRFGAVVDFVDVHAGSWHWPAFNLADSAITVGVAVLLVHGLFFDAHEGK
jgi:hypothetical protein